MRRFWLGTVFGIAITLVLIGSFALGSARISTAATASTPVAPANAQTWRGSTFNLNLDHAAKPNPATYWGDYLNTIPASCEVQYFTTPNKTTTTVTTNSPTTKTTNSTTTVTTDNSMTILWHCP